MTRRLEQRLTILEKERTRLTVAGGGAVDGKQGGIRRGAVENNKSVT